MIPVPTRAADLCPGDVIAIDGYPADLIQVTPLERGGTMAIYWGVGHDDGLLVHADMIFLVTIRATEWCDV